MIKIIKGFTLIELLVVISIIGILASLAIVSFGSTQKDARDTARKSDLKQFQNALQGAANNHKGVYPGYPNISGSQWGTFCTFIGVGSNCPNDPKMDPATYIPTYTYLSNGTTGSWNATKYVLYADLEDGGYWLICYNGRIFESAGAPRNVTACD